MKKFIVAVVIIGSFILYSFTYTHSNTVPVLPNSTTDSGSSNNGLSATVVPTTTNATVTAGSVYKDGTYMGSTADAHWGYIQVKAVIQNGKITDVRFLQYPNERNRSIEINNYADPRLTSEALQAQSANVDIITGATDTSEAFIQSLSDALSKANV